jgi:hypothetical protein
MPTPSESRRSSSFSSPGAPAADTDSAVLVLGGRSGVYARRAGSGQRVRRY